MQSPQTVADKAVVHLSHYLRYREAFVFPHEMTQDGISEALGASRGYVGRELRRLQEYGYVHCALARVAEGRRKRMVYNLTQKGERVAGRFSEARDGHAVQVPRGDGGNGDALNLFSREIAGSDVAGADRFRGIARPS